MKKIILVLVYCIFGLGGIEALYVPNEGLLNAIKSNDTSAVGNLLAKGDIDVNLRIDGIPVIALVAAQGHTDMAEVLWRTGKLNIEARTGDYGHTALHVAVMNRRFDMVKWLVEHGADVNALDKNMEPALYYTGRIPGVLRDKQGSVSVDGSPEAIMNEGENKIVSLYSTPSLYKYVGTDSSEKIAEYLKQNNADESKKKGELSEFGFNPFETAVELGDIDMILSMFADGFDPNEKIKGYLPIWYAICSEKPEIVRMLLQRGARASEKCMSQFPLEQAISKENVEIVRLLGEAAPETIGRGLLLAVKLCFCSHSERYYDVVNAVIDMASQEDVAAEDNYGMPIIFVAGWKLYEAIEGYRQKTDDEVEVNDRNFSSSVQTIKRLVEKGASLDGGLRYGATRGIILVVRNTLKNDMKHPDWVSKLDELLKL